MTTVTLNPGETYDFSAKSNYKKYGAFDVKIISPGEYTLPKKKKHISRKHGKYLHFTSDSPAAASVNAQGVVRAKNPGTATIYIQDTSGKYCTVRVTVR